MSLITLGLTMIFLSIVYLFVKRRYFSLRQSLPGIDPHLFFGNILQTRCLHDESYINIQSKLKQSFGDVYQYWLGPYHYYVFNKVEHAEHIFKNRTIYDLPSLTFGLQFPSGLVSIKGSDYQRHARVILPMFRKSKVQHHFQIILNATDKLIDQWLIQIDQNRPILNRDIGQQSKRLLLQIISASAFDYDLLSSSSTDKSIEIDRLAEALNIFTSMYDSLVKLTGIPTIFLHIYMKLNKEYQSAVEILRAYVTDIIERACKQLQRNDELYLRERFVIYRMIDAWLLNKESLDRRTSDKSDKGWTFQELVDEILVLILAGFATTSSALSWFIYYMSKYPIVQQKIKDELRETNLLKTNELHVESVNNLEYVDCVLKELLRYAPIVNSSRRTLTVDDSIDGVQLRKGDNVLVPLYNIHMDSRYWTRNPNEFIPERFLDEDKNHHPFALLTFGGGHRQCIGQDLARLELKTMIVRLMQKVSFHDAGQHLNSGGHRQSLTNSPKNMTVYIYRDDEILLKAMENR